MLILSWKKWQQGAQHPPFFFFQGILKNLTTFSWESEKKKKDGQQELIIWAVDSRVQEQKDQGTYQLVKNKQLVRESMENSSEDKDFPCFDMTGAHFQAGW